MKKEQNTSHHLQLEDGDVVYIRLPSFEKGTKVAKSVSLRELVKDYKGYDVELDFSEDGVLIGIEVLSF
jgi:uncharacterized protein YuzE